MKFQHDNLVMSNFSLWLNNYIVTKGEAFTNFASNLYHIGPVFNGYTSYSSPYKPFFWSTGVSGVNFDSGIWLNGSHLVKNESGFIDINYEKGEIYFNTPVTGTVSGRFCLPEFAVSLTSEPEETVLFETKYSLRPKVGQNVTGLQHNETTYPIIFLKKSASQGEPVAFGGLEDTQIDVTAYVFADSQFKLDAATAIIRDSCKRYIPLLQPSEMPFNVFGGLKNGVFDYNSATSGILTNDSVYISYVRELSLNRNFYTEARKLNPDVFFGVMDIQLSFFRYPRA